MDKPPRPPIGERLELLLEKPAARYAAVALASGLLHAGQIFHEQIGEAATRGGEEVTDLIRTVRCEVDAGDEHRTTASQEAVERIKEGIRPDIDLSDTYFASEAILACISDADIEQAKQRYDAIVTTAREMRAAGATPEEVMGYVLKQQGRYSEDEALFVNLLLRGRGNCEARMKFITAVAEDVYPEWAENHELMVQVFGAYIDEKGEEQPPHVRAVLEQGSEIVVLEGDAMAAEKRTAETAPMYDAEWLGMASFLAGTGALSYKGVGLDEGSDVKLEGTNSFLYYPHSSARYTGGAGTGDISPRQVDGSWAGSASAREKPVEIIGPISDEQFAAHREERRAYEEGELAERTAFYEHMAERGINVVESTLYLFTANGALPITYEEVQKFAAYRMADNHQLATYAIRPDQKLPPGVEHLINEPKLSVTNGYPTQETLGQLTRFDHIGIWLGPGVADLLAQNAAGWKTVDLAIVDPPTDSFANIPTETLVVTRQIGARNDRTINIAGINQPVSIEPCLFDGEILRGTTARSLSFTFCLPQGEVRSDGLESFGAAYFGPARMLPLITDARQGTLKNIELTVPHGVIPQDWLELDDTSGDDTDIVLRVGRVNTGALRNVAIKQIAFEPLFAQDLGLQLTNEYRTNFLTIESKAFEGARIKTLKLDLAGSNWTFAPDAFDGAQIDTVEITYGHDEEERVKAIRFPPSTNVIYH